MLKLKLIPFEDGFTRIQMSSADEELLNDLNEIFKTSENPLEFFQAGACKISHR
jgi:hypothetical protein